MFRSSRQPLATFSTPNRFAIVSESSPLLKL
jgi:hypothetical protein